VFEERLRWTKCYSVGGFNPSEKYESQLGSLFPNKTCLKPPTSIYFVCSSAMTSDLKKYLGDLIADGNQSSPLSSRANSSADGKAQKGKSNRKRFPSRK